MSTSIACIIYENGRILVAHRNPTGEMGGRWEFPGGKLDAEENDAQAIIREMREEFGVNAVPGRKITEGNFEHKGKMCFIHAYMVSLEHDGIAVPYTLTEHTEYRWVDPLDIKNLNFVDSDMKIYPYVLDFIKNCSE